MVMFENAIGHSKIMFLLNREEAMLNRRKQFLLCLKFYHPNWKCSSPSISARVLNCIHLEKRNIEFSGEFVRKKSNYSLTISKYSGDKIVTNF